ncbi:AAA family ATPase [Microbacterium sp. LRZ72]|uniref:AAA family ATPase n=1 Tax=Microbacterium sp. LRZ72 TaxID=2942481 RepID=UPI0029BEAD49|nr:AAA family ATPase [Microbacterium sp. LRZ72]MDX2377693.1 AAA family ATPase [Microbacterium sp. LRZ72]
MTRFVVVGGDITRDMLTAEQLRQWVDGRDPASGEQRGRDLSSPTADLILDGTINAPKSYSIAVLLHPELATEFQALQDRLRDRIITTWQHELNARRGAGGSIRESLHRVEVVELQHRRSRALDPHIHRHLWLNVKVQGEDGKWSNVDSRVAMKFHTVINAEGELAARTDPAWIAALARHGYTLDANGEIAELARAVRPLSRRSNQIEANRAVLVAQWRAEHPGQEPSHDVQQQIDRLAWATRRPNKPIRIDEDEWEHLIRNEVATIDLALVEPRAPVVAPEGAAGVDREVRAAKAVVDADARSASNGGRFSTFDLRAGVIRALAGAGLVGDRDSFQRLIDDIQARALTLTVDLLAGEGTRPGHVKGFMSVATASLKVDLAARLDTLAVPGEPLDADLVEDVARRVVTECVVLDAAQAQAAASIAGTDRLVSVTGPAGAGKTTMLRVASGALARQGRRMVVVAPTKKAAAVASREIGATASSLHALLADHGWRWTHDTAGASVWSRLSVGDIDPTSGHVFTGPRRYPLAPGDRVVVDEAGMVDLHTANALAVLAAETGAGIAMVGDHLQAMPVGHSGAMVCLTRRASAVVELTAVHRFRDPEYAALTLRMREPASQDAALAVAEDLDDRGLIHRVADHAEARDAMVDAYFRWTGAGKRVALVTSTNDEADAINEAIQQHRLDCGALHLGRVAVGQGELRILEGDIVQTRRNDTTAGVENRALWTVQLIGRAAVQLGSVNDAGDVRVVSHDYLAEHVHLAYASTVHGIQGETTDASIVGPGVDASGLYVGMTRGREHNAAITVARTRAAARDAIAESMLRGTVEVTVDDSARAARVELGRAAREPGRTPEAIATDRIPRLDDARARPWGMSPDLDRVEEPITAALIARQASRDELDAWLATTRRALLERAGALAATESSRHGTGRAPSADDGSDSAWEEVAALVETRTAESDVLEHEREHLQVWLDQVGVERWLRGSMGAEHRAAEDRLRQHPAQLTVLSSAVPSWGPSR